MTAPPPDSRPLKGFWYEVTDEQILQWLDVPVAERLRWLDEAREFLWQAMTPQAKEAMRRFREGSL